MFKKRIQPLRFLLNDRFDVPLLGKLSVMEIVGFVLIPVAVVGWYL